MNHIIPVLFLWLLIWLPDCRSGNRDGVEIIRLDPGKGISGHAQAHEAGHIKKGLAYTGNQSVEVNPEHRFGLAITIGDARPGERFTAEVWRRKQDAGNAFLVAECDWGLYLKQTLPVDGADDRGWELLRIGFTVPAWLDTGRIKFYVWNPNEDPVFFDDLVVQRVRPDSLPAAANPPSFDTLAFAIDSSAMDKLRKIRQKALQKGILEVTDNDWVKGRLLTKGKTIHAKFRLKGDWTDHLTGRKWSFRVKTAKTRFWNRIRTFSVQRPESRAFLREWLYHRLLLDQGGLAPRYGFLYLKINGEDKGIYAWEEFFEKQLLEYHHRHEGPILKFNEDGFWEDMARGGADTLTPYYAVSLIKPFKSGRTLSDPGLRTQFLRAQGLMDAYRKASAPVADLFDLPSVARFFALTDLTQAYHALRWHNLRFYYNPLTARLEPVAFDGFGEEPMPWPDPFIGFRQGNERLFREQGEALLTGQFFRDTAFYRMYIKTLYRYTSPRWLDSVLAALAPALRGYEKILRSEYPDYHFSVQELIHRAEDLRHRLLPGKNTALQAFRIASRGPQQTLVLKNIHALPLEVFAIGLEADEPGQYIRRAYLAPSARPEEGAWDTLRFTGEGDYLFYRVPGIDSVFSVPVTDYPPPAPVDFPETALQAQPGLFTIENGEVVFREGIHEVSADLFIPADYRVILPAGTTLELVHGAAFVSYSPVEIRGTEQEPVIIRSSDRTASGFSLIQAKGSSLFSYAVFEGLNALDRDGWTLTGSVTCYESPVRIEHCRFSDNPCEDALNIVRSEFSITGCRFARTQGDALDLDFSDGSIANTRFSDIGNDAMDFSGSRVQVDSCRVSHAGDKGLSAGEESHIRASRLLVEHTLRAVTAKDLSVLTLDSLTLRDCLYGFVAFQKKPEYGPATIRSGPFRAVHVKQLIKTADGSRVLFSR